MMSQISTIKLIETIFLFINFKYAIYEKFYICGFHLSWPVHTSYMFVAEIFIKFLKLSAKITASTQQQKLNCRRYETCQFILICQRRNYYFILLRFKRDKCDLPTI